MGLMSLVWGQLSKHLLPNKWDILIGVAITAAAYMTLTPEPLTLLLILAVGTAAAFILRRLWKLVVIWWAIRTAKKKVEGGIEGVKRFLKGGER